MDALFIFPPLTLEERYGDRRIKEDVGGSLPPLGIAYIASYLNKNNFKTGIIDALALDMNEDDIIKRIDEVDSRVIGISSLTPNFYRAADLAAKIKEKFVDKLIIIGGQHATIMKESLLDENPYFDILVYGEGEITALELLSRFKEHNYILKNFLSNYSCLDSIQGISYRVGNKIKLTFPRQPIQDLNSLPDPAWELLPMHKYIPLPNQYLRRPIVHMVAMRGCPFNCTFCSCNAVFGRKVRRMSPRRIIDSFKNAQKKFGAREISFWDDTITVDTKWMKELCQIIIDEKIDVTWTCLCRVDTVTKDLLKLMKKAGCWNIFYGFEAGDQRLLDNIDKGITIDQIKNAVKWTKDAGIEIRASFMLALPGETPQLAKKTIDFSIELDPDYVQFCITTPYPGTKLYKDAEKFGKLYSDLSKYSIWHPVFVPYGYKDAREVAKIEREALRKFYLRPKYIIKKLFQIRGLEDIKRYYKGLKMALGLIRG